jgi:putative glycosyltransferase
MKLSIVTTAYYSCHHLQEFYERATSVAQEYFGEDYEIIFVNDCSPDESEKIIRSFCVLDSHITLIDLSRNFGHHKAIMTGLEHSKGEIIFLIDCDLEEEPEWLHHFLHKYNNTENDVVYGIQKKRRGSVFERLSGNLFYAFINHMAGISISKNIVIARLMSRRYVDALLGHKESEIFLAGLFSITGFKQLAIEVVKHSTSKTTYTFRKKIVMVIAAITSFSSAPLIGIFNIGIVISCISAANLIYLLTSWTFFERPLSGWTSVMASIWLLGGMIILFIGIIGIYLSKVYIETKQRPYSIIREIFNKQH